jgi:hypothetical protein
MKKIVFFSIRERKEENMEKIVEKVFFLAVLATIVYSIIRVVEMKYIEKEWKPVKEVVRDAAYVFLSTAVAGFATLYMNGSMTDFYNVLTKTKTLDAAATQVFTDEPAF